MLDRGGNLIHHALMVETQDNHDHLIFLLLDHGADVHYSNNGG
jgi:hypothetical protein